MNRLAHILTATVCLGGAGCFSARSSAPSSFPVLAARNFAQQPLRLLDNKAFLKVVGGHADAAWEANCRGKAASPSYAAGFREGFIDYVDAGGTGEPPYLPPFRYRKTRFQTDAGIEVVEDWYAGFRHGSAVAQASGLREKVLVPLPGSADPAGSVHSSPVEQPALAPAGPRTLPPPTALAPIPQPLPVPGAADVPPPRVVPRAEPGSGRMPAYSLVRPVAGWSLPAPAAVRPNEADGDWQPARQRE